MSLWSAKDAALAARLLRPEILPSDFLAYVQDYIALNQPPAPQVVGSQFYAKQLDANGTLADFKSSAGEQTVYSYDVQGGTLETEGALYLALNGDYLNNTGSNRTFTLKVKYGGSVLYEDGSPSLTSNVNRMVLNLGFYLTSGGGASDQNMTGFMEISDRSSTPTTGTGRLSTVSFRYVFAGALSGTVNSSATKTLAVTITHSAAADTLSYRRLYALLQEIGH